MTQIRLVACNPRGLPCGPSHWWTKHGFEKVERAQLMRATGASYRAISEALGVGLGTAWRWCDGQRQAPARVIARRVKSPPAESSSSEARCASTSCADAAN
jgi:hypothetical protein